MSQDIRGTFYNLRNQFDKQKNWALNVGEIVCAEYFKLMPDIAGKVVLDAGIGTGWLTRALAARVPGFIFGMDISSERVEETVEYFKSLQLSSYFQTGSIENLNFIRDEALDFINCRDVIEHLPHPEECLKEFIRTLKPGGKLLIQTVNDLVHSHLKIELYFHRLLYFLLTGEESRGGAGPFLGDDSMQLEGGRQELLKKILDGEIHEHEHQWGPAEFIALLEEHGFKAQALAGTPLLASSFFQLGAQAPGMTEGYVTFAKSESYKPFLEVLRRDLQALGRVPDEIMDLPIDYAFSDDLIVLAEKPL